MTKEQIPNCYGNCDKRNIQCRKCLYNRSCAYFRQTQSKVESLSGLVSFDNTVCEWFIPEDQPIPGETKEEDLHEELMAGLAKILRWLVSLDNYSLGIVSELIAPDAIDHSKKGVNVALLAKRRGITRQSMHEKMLHSVAEHPELATLFQTALRKVGNLRSQFRRLSAVRDEA